MARVKMTNPQIKKKIFKTANNLSGKVSKNSFPVIMRSIARHSRVDSVAFQPIFSTGALLTTSSGFKIYINSSRDLSKELSNRYDKESSGNLLPYRIRFAIAHEIAHTLMYELDSANPVESIQQLRSGGGKSEKDQLENFCDEVAGDLLLPKTAYQRFLSEEGDITAPFIQKLCTVSGLPSKVLVKTIDRRKGSLDIIGFRGAIISYENVSQDGSWLIGSIARGTTCNLNDLTGRIRPGTIITKDNSTMFDILNGDISEGSDLFAKNYQVSMAKISDTGEQIVIIAAKE